MPLPSAPIDQFEEATTVQPNDWAVIFQVATGKTLKTRSSNFGIDSPSSNYNWSSTFDYPVDDIVEYQGKLYKSLQTPNVGQVPTASGSLYWELVVKGTTSSLAAWAAGVYVEETVFVLYDLNQNAEAPAWGLYALTDPPARPFSSTDFVAELALGYWSKITNDKLDAVTTVKTKVGSHTLDAADLADSLLGKNLIFEGDGSGTLAVPANATRAFLQGFGAGVRGFTAVDATAVTGAGGSITGTRGDLTLPAGMTSILEKRSTNIWILHNGSAGGITPIIYWGVTTGTNTYAVTLAPVLTALTTGVGIKVKIATASTGAATLNPNTLGAKKIFKNPTTQAGSGDLVLNQIYELTYDAALDSAAGGWLIDGSGVTSGGGGVASYYGSTSGTNTYTSALSPTLGALATGVTAKVKFGAASTGAATFNPDSLGATKIFKNTTTQAGNGDIIIGIYDLTYDATLDSAAGGWLMEVDNTAGGAATWGLITGSLASQADLQAALDLKLDKAVVVNAPNMASVSSYTLQNSDCNKHVQISKATACNVQIPNTTTATIDVNKPILITQTGAGQVTFDPDTGVTILSSATRKRLFGQYSGAYVMRLTGDTWLLQGDLVS
jgi:hypothetical protein